MARASLPHTLFYTAAGEPLAFYVSSDASFHHLRWTIIHLIREGGGRWVAREPEHADIILVSITSNEAQTAANIYPLVLDFDWIRHCAAERRVFGEAEVWAGYRVNGSNGASSMSANRELARLTRGDKDTEHTPFPKVRPVPDLDDPHMPTRTRTCHNSHEVILTPKTFPSSLSWNHLGYPPSSEPNRFASVAQHITRNTTNDHHGLSRQDPGVSHRGHLEHCDLPVNRSHTYHHSSSSRSGGSGLPHIPVFPHGLGTGGHLEPISTASLPHARFLSPNGQIPSTSSISRAPFTQEENAFAVHYIEKRLKEDREQGLGNIVAEIARQLPQHSLGQWNTYVKANIKNLLSMINLSPRLVVSNDDDTTVNPTHPYPTRSTPTLSGQQGEFEESESEVQNALALESSPKQMSGDTLPSFQESHGGEEPVFRPIEKMARKGRSQASFSEDEKDFFVKYATWRLQLDPSAGMFVVLEEMAAKVTNHSHESWTDHYDQYKRYYDERIQLLGNFKDREPPKPASKMEVIQVHSERDSNRTGSIIKISDDDESDIDQEIATVDVDRRANVNLRSSNYTQKEFEDVVEYISTELKGILRGGTRDWVKFAEAHPHRSMHAWRMYAKRKEIQIQAVLAQQSQEGSASQPGQAKTHTSDVPVPEDPPAVQLKNLVMNRTTRLQSRTDPLSQDGVPGDDITRSLSYSTDSDSSDSEGWTQPARKRQSMAYTGEDFHAVLKYVDTDLGGVFSVSKSDWEQFIAVHPKHSQKSWLDYLRRSQHEIREELNRRANDQISASGKKRAGSSDINEATALRVKIRRR